jgi:hypothetical protein
MERAVPILEEDFPQVGIEGGYCSKDVGRPVGKGLGLNPR